MASQRRIRLLAYNVRSLWNVGAFFRTCDALHIEHLYLAGYTGHPPRKEISKTALGAEEFIPWEQCKDPVGAISNLKKEGWQIVSLELTKDSEVLDDIKLTDQVCLIVGHELDGVPSELIELSDVVTHIPMLGQKESLNVAVATGIALYRLRSK